MGADDVSIRPCLPDDREHVLAFRCANDDPDDTWSLEAQAALIEAAYWSEDPDDDTIMLVAVDRAQRIVGVIAACTDEDYGEPMIKSMGVVHDRRCEGIGFDLKVRALVELSARAARRLTVYSVVHHRNAPMNRVNEKLRATRGNVEVDPGYWLWAAPVELED